MSWHSGLGPRLLCYTGLARPCGAGRFLFARPPALAVTYVLQFGSARVVVGEAQRCYSAAWSFRPGTDILFLGRTGSIYTSYRLARDAVRFRLYLPTSPWWQKYGIGGRPMEGTFDYLPLSDSGHAHVLDVLVPSSNWGSSPLRQSARGRPHSVYVPVPGDGIAVLFRLLIAQADAFGEHNWPLKQEGAAPIGRMLRDETTIVWLVAQYLDERLEQNAWSHAYGKPDLVAGLPNAEFWYAVEWARRAAGGISPDGVPFVVDLADPPETWRYAWGRLERPQPNPVPQSALRPLRYPCACCGYYTQKLPAGFGTHETCPVCFWEDDPFQYRFPYARGGANKHSLVASRYIYRQIGAKETRARRFVRPLQPEWLPPVFLLPARAASAAPADAPA